MYCQKDIHKIQKGTKLYVSARYIAGTICGKGSILLVLHFQQIEAVADLGKLVWLLLLAVNRMQLCFVCWCYVKTIIQGLRADVQISLVYIMLMFICAWQLLFSKAMYDTKI